MLIFTLQHILFSKAKIKTKKGNDSVCLCRFSLQTLTMTVESYFNEDSVLDVIDQNDRNLGISANISRVDIYKR